MKDINDFPRSSGVYRILGSSGRTTSADVTHYSYV